jgi:multidrug resistance protein
MATTESAHTVVLDEKHAESHDTPASTSSTDVPSLTDKEHAPAQSRVDPDIENGIPVIDTTEDADVKSPATVADEHDPNIVDWDGPDDPDKAMNWPNSRKWANVSIISTVTFLTPLASSMVAPAVPLVLAEFNTSNATIASFIVSIYILGYALGPLFLAPLSEVYGRLPVYHVCNFMFVVWTMACALSPSIGALLVFRLLAGIAGSCPLTIGAGSIADLIRQEKRGGAMAIFALGPLLGPVIGPVAGGFLGQAAGWRWVFWLITIAVSSRSPNEGLSGY